jgi:hypothetical protein
MHLEDIKKIFARVGQEVSNYFKEDILLGIKVEVQVLIEVIKVVVT